MKQIIISLLFLGWNSILDIRKKKISLVLVGIYVLIWLLFFMMGTIEEGQLYDSLLGLIPGILLLLVGVISRGALGLGDGMLVMPIGLYFGFRTSMAMVLAALMFAFGWAVILLCFGKRKQTYAFPFAPFLFVGLIGAIIL